MNRSVAALALVSLLTPACTMTRSGSRTSMAAGAGMAVAGLLVSHDTTVDADHNGINENPLDDDLGAEMLGALLVIGGVVLFAAGATAQEPAPAPAAFTPAPVEVVMGPPSAPIAAAEYRGLPEAPVTVATLRLAQQVRSAVLREECDAAWQTLGAIQLADPSYAAVLATSSVMRGCERVQ